MNTYGYIRVSTREQNIDRQVNALLEYGVPKENLVIEKQSGKDFNRPKYRGLVRKLKAGDALVVKSIDRLGRNYDDILEEWRFVTKEKRADIVVLDMPLLDTRVGRDLTGTLISDIVLQLLSYVAETEREYIRQRQREGIEAAKEKGVRFGRKPCERPNNYNIVIKKWKNRTMSGVAAAKSLGVSRSVFYRWLKEDKIERNS